MDCVKLDAFLDDEVNAADEAEDDPWIFATWFFELEATTADD